MIPFLLVFRRFLQLSKRSWRDPNTRPLALWLVLLLSIGTLFYHSTEGWSWLDSLYFSVIALATVGFGDLAPVTAIGKIFTIFYVLIGIGTLLAFVDATMQRPPVSTPADRPGAEPLQPTLEPESNESYPPG